MAVPNEYPFDKAGVFWKEVTPDATFDETDFSYGSTNDRIKLHPVRYPESNNIYLTSNLSVVQIPTLDAKSNPNIKFRPAINPYDLKENLNFKLRNQFDEYEIEIESEPLLTVFYKPGNIFVYFVKTPATHSTPQNTVYAAIYIANPKLEYSNAQAYYEAYQNKEKFNNAILIEPLILESPKGIKKRELPPKKEFRPSDIPIPVPVLVDVAPEKKKKKKKLPKSVPVPVPVDVAKPAPKEEGWVWSFFTRLFGAEKTVPAQEIAVITGEPKLTVKTKKLPVPSEINYMKLRRLQIRASLYPTQVIILQYHDKALHHLSVQTISRGESIKSKKGEILKKLQEAAYSYFL